MTSNYEDGRNFYHTASQEDREWMHHQWLKWPTRVHPERTTNIAFHCGGIAAYKTLNNSLPVMSREMKHNWEYLSVR